MLFVVYSTTICTSYTKHCYLASEEIGREKYNMTIDNVLVSIKTRWDEI
jgi:hypothetical protein